MNSFKWFLSIVIICLCNISCENKCNVNGVEIGSLLISNAEKQGVNYCELVEKSFNNDNISIRKLCLLHFENSVGYAHGEILVSLLLKIGEQQFINALKDISKKDKHKVESYLDVGLEYSASHLIKDDFPKVYSFLKE